MPDNAERAADQIHEGCSWQVSKAAVIKTPNVYRFLEVDNKGSGNVAYLRAQQGSLLVFIWCLGIIVTMANTPDPEKRIDNA